MSRAIQMSWMPYSMVAGVTSVVAVLLAQCGPPAGAATRSPRTTTSKTTCPGPGSSVTGAFQPPALSILSSPSHLAWTPPKDHFIWQTSYTFASAIVQAASGAKARCSATANRPKSSKIGWDEMESHPQRRPDLHGRRNFCPKNGSPNGSVAGDFKQSGVRMTPVEKNNVRLEAGLGKLKSRGRWTHRKAHLKSPTGCPRTRSQDHTERLPPAMAATPWPSAPTTSTCQSSCRMSMATRPSVTLRQQR